jgi:hypothetical protein
VTAVEKQLEIVYFPVQTEVECKEGMDVQRIKGESLRYIVNEALKKYFEQKTMVKEKLYTLKI